MADGLGCRFHRRIERSSLANTAYASSHESSDSLYSSKSTFLFMSPCHHTYSWDIFQRATWTLECICRYANDQLDFQCLGIRSATSATNSLPVPSVFLDFPCPSFVPYTYAGQIVGSSCFRLWDMRACMSKTVVKQLHLINFFKSTSIDSLDLNTSCQFML